MLCAREYLAEHVRRQALRLGVVATAVVRIDEPSTTCEPMLGRMSKAISTATLACGIENGIVRNSTERDEYTQALVSSELGAKKTVAASRLGGRRFVLGRKALHCVGDANTEECEPVAHRLGLRRRRHAEFMQSLVKHDSGVIAGEGSSRSIGPVHPRSKANDQPARIGVPESRNRSRMVARVA